MSEKPAASIAIGVKIGFALLIAAGIATLYLHDWRLIVAGALLFLLSVVVSAPSRRGAS